MIVSWRPIFPLEPINLKNYLKSHLPSALPLHPCQRSCWRTAAQSDCTLCTNPKTENRRILSLLCSGKYKDHWRLVLIHCSFQNWTRLQKVNVVSLRARRFEKMVLSRQVTAGKVFDRHTAENESHPHRASMSDGWRRVDDEPSVTFKKKKKTRQRDLGHIE